eukprot:1778257-Rhodomonas_salina.3
MHDTPLAVYQRVSHTVYRVSQRHWYRSIPPHYHVHMRLPHTVFHSGHVANPCDATRVPCTRVGA